ncbi:MAG: ABC transporter permease, partial [Deferribacterales bacterium]|nr:ABC transporter permease [Deferribacterales bacterium]
MKKILSIALLFLLLTTISFAKTINVGISQIVEHPALDACRQGIIDKLKELG